MNKDNYIFEEVDRGGGVPETMIKIPRDKITIGQKIYQVDFYYDDSVQELEVRGVEDYINCIDPQTGEEFTRPPKAGESSEGYFIILGDDWEVSPYEMYLTRGDAYEAALKVNASFIKDNQTMVDRWLHAIDNAEIRISTIKEAINNIKK